MLYSEKEKMLVISIPKTGTVTVQNALYGIIPDGEMHSITVDGKTYKGRDFEQGIVNHARAR